MFSYMFNVSVHVYIISCWTNKKIGWIYDFNYYATTLEIKMYPKKKKSLFIN